MKIEEKLEELKQTASDINEHLQTIFEQAKGCERLTEMGVRGAVSTWALLAARPNKLVSYDINKCPGVTAVQQAAREEALEYSFVQTDVLKVEIDPTEVLFIDTLHTYSQLSRELAKHADKVQRKIILHDTETYGEVDEPIYFPSSPQTNSSKQGLKAAIADFLSSERGSSWRVESVFQNNNGLTVLGKK
jgi:hypothetical protein